MDINKTMELSKTIKRMSSTRMENLKPTTSVDFAANNDCGLDFTNKTGNLHQPGELHTVTVKQTKVSNQQNCGLEPKKRGDFTGKTKDLKHLISTQLGLRGVNTHPVIHAIKDP